MATIHDVSPEIFIKALAEELKKTEEIKAPEWTVFVKTGRSKERPPVQADWWYIRAASMLRSIQMRGPLGVGKLRLKYGGKANRGYKTEHFYKSSGKIIRVLLQQLESAGLVEQKKVGVHKGRVVTKKGLSFMDKFALGLVPKKAEQQNVTGKKTKQKAEASQTKQEN